MHYCRWLSRLQAKKVMPTDCSYKSTAQEFQLVFLGKPHGTVSECLITKNGCFSVKQYLIQFCTIIKCILFQCNLFRKAQIFQCVAILKGRISNCDSFWKDDTSQCITVIKASISDAFRCIWKFYAKQRRAFIECAFSKCYKRLRKMNGNQVITRTKCFVSNVDNSVWNGNFF